MSYPRNETENEKAFREGRTFRIAYEFSFADNSAGDVVKVEIGSDMVLTKSLLSVDGGGVRYSVSYGAVTEGGTFGTPVTVFPKNGMSGAPSIASKNTFSTGGTITGGSSFVVDRVRTASGNNQRATNVSDSSEQRGFAPSTVYLVLEPLDSVNDTCEGILNLEWREVA